MTEKCNQRKVKVVVAILLHVRIVESHICVMFRIIQKLAVPVLVGTMFKEKSIRAICFRDTKIVTFNYRPIPILIVYETKYDNTEEQENNLVSNIVAKKTLTKEWYKLHVL